MTNRDREEPNPADSPTPEPASEGGWSEEGRRWYEELTEEEGTIAPWLSFEWTGEQMRVRRG
ncbi:MAG: hypothetical protein ACM3US_15470 [Sphingomonadaceae bacterium]